MPTPQNLPALIKEMQMKGRTLGKYEMVENFKEIEQKFTLTGEELDTLIADTANTILEYVKGVAGELRPEYPKDKHAGKSFCPQCEDTGAYHALTNLIARLTSNPQ